MRERGESGVVERMELRGRVQRLCFEFLRAAAAS